MDYDLSELTGIAKKALLENIIQTDEGAFVRAGGHQFRSLWTRDFCFAVPGLIAAGQTDVATNHLQALINNRRQSDGLVPRVLESGFGSALRVIKGSISQKVPMFGLSDPKSPLKPEYYGEHKTISIDSNLLLLLALFQVVEATGDISLINKNKKALLEIYNFYASSFSDGLISQDSFEDWQDSVKRKGVTSYTNALYIIVSEIIYKHQYFRIDLVRVQRMKKLFYEKFFHKKHRLFKALEELDLVSLDTNLLICDFGVHFSELRPEELYINLKNSALWKSCHLPGLCSNKNYPSSWVSWTTRVVGLNTYHGLKHWSWLIGYAAKVSSVMNDKEEALRILANLQVMANRDGTIYEIYHSTNKLEPFSNSLYQSEYPFSWGAGKILEGLAAL